MSSEQIKSGEVVLGIEFGSTRIKSDLIGPDFQVIASGSTLVSQVTAFVNENDEDTPEYSITFYFISLKK